MSKENIGLELEVVPQFSEAEKEINNFKNQQENNPIKLNVEVKDLDKAKDYITKKLENNLEGIGEKFQRIKTEVNLIESGKFKGMYRAVETFANDLNETKKRVVIFKDAANGAYQEVSASVQKVIDHNLNYQQAMELTAKKLSTLNKEVSTSKIFKNGEWTGGWKEVTDSIMSSNQQLRTTITEEEEAGVLVRRIRQEVRKLNDDLTPKEGEAGKFQLFGKESVERINLAEQAYKKLNDKLRETKQLSEEVHRFTATDRTGSLTGKEGTKVENVWKTTEDQYGNKYQTQTRRWQDELGNTIEQVSARIKQQGKAWEKLKVISTKTSSDEIANQEKLNKTIREKNEIVNSYKTTVKGISHDIEEQTTKTETYGGVVKETSVITDKFTDAQGRLVTQITRVNEDGQKTEETLIKMGNAAKSVGQRFSDVIVKVAKFYVASLPVRAVQKAITEAAQAVKDFDSALTEFKKVSDLSGKSLDDYALKLEKLGELTARTRTEMMQMATEFKRSGYSDEEAANLAQVGSLYQNIADEELSASDASSVLISQMKAFQKQGIKAEEVIDSINEVANRNAVSSGDIGRGLTQAGAALSTYGNTFQQTIGLVTAGTEIDYWKVS